MQEIKAGVGHTTGSQKSEMKKKLKLMKRGPSDQSYQKDNKKKKDRMNTTSHFK